MSFLFPKECFCVSLVYSKGCQKGHELLSVRRILSKVFSRLWKERRISCPIVRFRPQTNSIINDVKCAWQISLYSLYSTFSMVFHLQGSNNLQNHGDHMWHKIKVCWLSLLTCMPTCFSSHERNIFRSSTSCTYRLQGGPTTSGQIRMDLVP